MSHLGLRIYDLRFQGYLAGEVVADQIINRKS